MVLEEYTVERANRLNHFFIPETVSPFRIQVLWAQLIHTGMAQREIFSGRHKHSFCEVHLILEGQVAYDVEGETVHLSAGQALLLGPGTAHQHLEQGKDHFKCALAFTADKNSAFYAELLLHPKEVFSFGENVLGHLRSALNQIDRNTCLSSRIVRERIFELIDTVLSSIGFHYPPETEVLPSEDRRFAVAREFITSHANRSISCEEVAQECGLSSKQLSRIFHQQTGQSLYEYIKQTRLKTCEELLLRNDLSIKEISRMMGFENECYFNSFFKRHFGMPPGCFRKQNAHPEKR